MVSFSTEEWGNFNIYEGDAILVEELEKLARALERAESVADIENLTLRYSNRAEYTDEPKMVKINGYNSQELIIPFGTPEDTLVPSIAEALEDNRTIRSLEEDVVRELHDNYNFNFSEAVRTGPHYPIRSFYVFGQGPYEGVATPDPKDYAMPLARLLRALRTHESKEGIDLKDTIIGITNRGSGIRLSPITID